MPQRYDESKAEKRRRLDSRYKLEEHFNCVTATGVGTGIDVIVRTFHKSRSIRDGYNRKVSDVWQTIDCDDPSNPMKKKGRYLGRFRWRPIDIDFWFEVFEYEQVAEWNGNMALFVEEVVRAAGGTRRARVSI